MHTTTATPAPALPGGRNPLRARNAAIAALGIVSAVMVAAGAAIGGGKPTPSHTRPPRLASTPASPVHLHEHNAVTKGGGRRSRRPHISDTADQGPERFQRFQP
jgi:hypothetical protein